MDAAVIKTQRTNKRKKQREDEEKETEGRESKSIKHEEWRAKGTDRQREIKKDQRDKRERKQRGHAAKDPLLQAVLGHFPRLPCNRSQGRFVQKKTPPFTGSLSVILHSSEHSLPPWHEPQMGWWKLPPTRSDREMIKQEKGHAAVGKRMSAVSGKESGFQVYIWKEKQKNDTRGGAEKNN